MLLVIDSDHIEIYNDCYGHLGSDNRLREVAQIFSACVWPYGGKEFAIF